MPLDVYMFESFYNLCTLVGNKTTAFRWRTAVCCVQRSWRL